MLALYCPHKPASLYSGTLSMDQVLWNASDLKSDANAKPGRLGRHFATSSSPRKGKAHQGGLYTGGDGHWESDLVYLSVLDVLKSAALALIAEMAEAAVGHVYHRLSILG